MKLLNYTTTISVDKTFSEISNTLREAGAQGILSEYDSSKNLSAISFRIQTAMGFISYRIPSRMDRIYKEIQKGQYHKIPKSQRTVEQAARIGWRIIKDWISAQMSLIQADQVDMEQVFLPYMQVQDGKTTVYEFLKDNNYKHIGITYGAGT